MINICDIKDMNNIEAITMLTGFVGERDPPITVRMIYRPGSCSANSFVKLYCMYCSAPIGTNPADHFWRNSECLDKAHREGKLRNLKKRL